MVTWRPPSAFTHLLLVPMFVLGLNHLASPTCALKNLASSDAAATCAEELMALYSGPARAGAMSAARAAELRSCVRPLVPYHEIVPDVMRRRSLQEFSTVDDLMEVNARLVSGERVDEEKMERLVQWPPSSVLSLARRSVVFGGDPAAVLSELSPLRYPVPDVENSTAERCYLTKYDYGNRFEDNVINSYIVFLFHAITLLSPFVGFNVSLSRFDLFHGHLFTTYDTNRLGILFHSREYPKYDEEIFPLNLGYCQKGSEIPYDISMDLRNILWLAPLATCTEKGVCSDDWLASGVLMILDAKEGGVVYRELIPEYLDFVRTVSEEEFGHHIADINYLNIGISPPENRVKNRCERLRSRGEDWEDMEEIEKPCHSQSSQGPKRSHTIFMARIGSTILSPSSQSSENQTSWTRYDIPRVAAGLQKVISVLWSNLEEEELSLREV